MPRQKAGEESARTKVREWIRELTEGRNEVRLVDITSDALSHFTGDGEFVQQFLSETLRPMVYELAQECLAAGREQYIDQVTRNIQDGKAPRSGVFASWFEHAGDKHISLMEMTKSDLYKAAGERQERGEHEIALAGLWREMASKLTNPNMKVKRVFTEEQVQEMLHALKPVDTDMGMAAD